jgi:predicted NBD/HSP70 family sugar kinase
MTAIFILLVNLTYRMTRSPAIPGLLRDLNERTVLDLIRSSAPISRAEISRRAGISKPTVSLALRSLVEGGIVRETSQVPGRPHYGAVYFEPVPEAALVLGFDLGARFLRGALSDLRGEVRARQDVEVGGDDIGGVIDAAVGLHASLLEASGFAPELVDCAVVGVPGVVPAGRGRIALAGDIPGLGEHEVGVELEERLGLPVTLENDVNLAALGEHWRGVAHGVDDFAFLSVGTGLGAGIVLDGRLHRGRHGAAGELDYTRAGRADHADPSAGAISAFAGGIAAGAETTLEPPYDTRAIFAAARAGDAVAAAVVEETARRIALHVVPVASTVDVPLVVLGGGIGANGDLLLEPVRRLLAEWLPFPPRLEVSTLGDGAVLTGALATGLRAAHESVFTRRARA